MKNPHSEIIPEGRETFCSFTWDEMNRSVFYDVGVLALYCVPLISIIVLYSRIMTHFRQTKAVEEEQEGTRMRNMQQNRIVMKVFVWIVSALLICWTPLCVYLALKLFFPLMFSNDACILSLAGWIFYFFSPMKMQRLYPWIFSPADDQNKSGFKLKTFGRRFQCSLS